MKSDSIVSGLEGRPIREFSLLILVCEWIRTGECTVRPEVGLS